MEEKLKLLYKESEILARLDTLAQEINTFYQDREVTAVILMNGALFFAADLLRRLNMPLQLDSISAASYVHDRSSGQVTVRGVPKLSPKGRKILLLDDILDTGATMTKLIQYFQQQGAADVRSCVLLDKEVPRAPGAIAHADFTAFTVPDHYIVGYGMDSEEYGRNRPDISYMI